MNPILVTGGARGLGAALCKALAQKGHDLVIHYRSSQQEANEVAQHCRASGVQVALLQGDFTQQSSAEDFIRRYLELTSSTKGIVHNVGNYLIAPPSATTTEQWTSLFQTNLFSPIAISHALLPHLKKVQGSILNIGLAGLEGRRGMLKATAYAASKSTLLFYTRSLAKELAPERIRVNMLSPGYMENAVDLIPSEQFPMRRAAYLSEVAEIASMFFDPTTQYITGQNIEVAGGIGL